MNKTNISEAQPTYYKGPASKNSQFIPKNIKEYPLEATKTENKDEIQECIFPMKEIDLKLFYLIQDHKYSNNSIISNIDKKIPELKEIYQNFYFTNILDFKKGFDFKLDVIQNLHKKSEVYKYQMTKMYIEKHEIQKEVILPKIEKISLSHKNDAEIKHEEEVEKENMLRQKEDEEAVQKSINQSSRNNVIVDERELEELMAKLDPLNKYRQVAVNEIPEMLYNPLDMLMETSYKDVNSLLMNKTKWAELTTKDAKIKLHPFTEEEEKLFYEGFMLYPKEFGKICKYMKQKRTVAELISYYYHTKLQKNYFEKYLKMKEDMEKEKEMKKLKKKTLKQQGKGNLTGSPNISATATPIVSGKKKIDKINNETPKKQPKRTASFEKVNSSIITNGDNSLVLTDNEKIDANVQNKTGTTIDNIPDIKSEISKNLLIQDNLVTEELKAENINAVKTETEFNSLSILTNEREDGKTVKIVNADQDQSELGKKRKLSFDTLSASETPSLKKTNNSKTSYWSVNEAAAFPGLLKKHGKDWKSISADIGTKSVTMIRNYFMKRGQELGFDAYVDEFVQQQKALGIDVVQKDESFSSKNSRSISPIEPQSQASIDKQPITEHTHHILKTIQPMPQPEIKANLILEQPVESRLQEQQVALKSLTPSMPKQLTQMVTPTEPVKPGQQQKTSPQQLAQSIQVQPLIQPKVESTLELQDKKIPNLLANENQETLATNKSLHILPPLSQQLLNKRSGYILSGQRTQNLPKPMKPSLELFPQQQNSPLQPIKPKLSHQLPPLALRKVSPMGAMSSSPFEQQTPVSKSVIPSYNSQMATKANTFPLPHLSSNNNTAGNKMQINNYNNSVPISPNILQNSSNQNKLNLNSNAINKYNYSASTKSSASTPTQLHHSTSKSTPSSFLPTSIAAQNSKVFGRGIIPPLQPNKIVQHQTYSQPLQKSATSFFDPLSALAAIASNEQKLIEEEEKKSKQNEK
ncbi:hypothetical protein QEN19_002868 [Hanseniaspora menglaensis]